ncbi:hypothetical protein ACPCHT_34335 [Nucisporomicrobium flavum]|uniref:hypothetical protein n=1 Tax=Nucisporomicrobium flavum TaxID=2785915 RepID=UPI0018F2F00B|nr:hypothetical protein [Nucisporomicrobium flavum]
MTVRHEGPRLTNHGRDPAVPHPRSVPLEPPRGAADLPRYLRALRRLGDADDLAAAYAGCTIAVEVAGREGDAAGLVAAYSQRSSVSRRSGDLPAAARDAEAAADLLAVSGAEPGGATAALLLSRRIAVLLDMGDVDRAGLLFAAAPFGGDLPDDPEFLLLRYVRGRLHGAAGRPGDALADWYRCGERVAVRRFDHPGVLPWRSAAADVLTGIGAAEAAERLVAEEVALTRRHGLASALGRALRIQGRVLPGAAGLARAEEAVRVLQGAPRRFELATALVDLGELLHQAKRRPQARRVLRDGLELAERCGSPGLAARARRTTRGRAT